MKKLSVILICAVMLLCGCSKKGSEENTQIGWRINSFYNMTDPNVKGMFFTGVQPDNENDTLKILDFNSMEQAEICNKPNCSHKDKESCTAFGKGNHPFIYNEKLYYFRNSEIYQENEIFKKDSALYQSDIDGSNEKQVAEFKEMSFEYYDKLLIDGEKIYMCMKNQPSDKDYKTMEGSCHFMSVDLEKEEISDFGEISKGYSFGGAVLGIWNGKVIYTSSKAMDDRPYLDKVKEYAEKNNLTEKKAMQTFEDNTEYISEYFEFDTDSKKSSKLSLPEPLLITKKFYFFNDEETLKYYDENGKEGSAENVKTPEEITDLGECAYIHTKSKNFIFDYDKKEVKALDNFDENKEPVSVYNNDMIIKNADENDGINFEKKKLSELVK